jgi:hypothetical protein
VPPANFATIQLNQFADHELEDAVVGTADHPLHHGSTDLLAVDALEHLGHRLVDHKCGIEAGRLADADPAEIF